MAFLIGGQDAQARTNYRGDQKMRGETGTRAKPGGVSAGVEDQLVSGVQTFSRDAAGSPGGGTGAGAARRRIGRKCADAGLGTRGAEAGTAAQSRGILRTWDPSCGNAARAHRLEQMAHKFVLLVREFHLEREWADVVKIVVGKFPLLETSIQRSALSIQPRNAVEQEPKETMGRQNENQNEGKPGTTEHTEDQDGKNGILEGRYH